MFRPYRLWLAAAAFILAVVWLAAAAAPSYAHAIPVTSNPRPNSILETSPPSISIQFSEPIVPNLSNITLLSQAGQAVNADPFVVSEDNTSMILTLPLLSNGTYLVSWRVLSSVDGHTTSGTFSFGVGVTSLGVTGATSDTNVRIAPLSISSRWGTLLGITLLLGFYAFRVFILPADKPLQKGHFRLPLVGVILLSIGLLLTLIDQSGQYNLWELDNFRAWLGTRFGQMWLLRLFLTGVHGYFLLVVWQKAKVDPDGAKEIYKPLWYWLGMGLGVLLAVTSSLVSHSAALRDEQLRMTMIDLVHLAAAAVWIGALFQLGYTLWQSRHLPAEERAKFNLALNLNFSSVGAAAVALLIISGSYLAFTHIGSWAALVGTTYGLILLAKIALTLPTFFIASVNLLVIKPRLDRTPPTLATLQGFNTLVFVETVIAICVLFAAGILIEIQRAADAPLLADAPGRLVLEDTIDDLNIVMAIEPALVGNNTFDIFITDQNGQPVNVTDVFVRFTFLGQSLGADEGHAMLHGDGYYQLPGSYISLIGEWQMEIAIRRHGSYDSFAPFRVEAGIGGTIRLPSSDDIGVAEQFARYMTIMGGGVIGIFFILFGLAWLFLVKQAAHTPRQLIILLGLAAFILISGINITYIFFTQNYTPAKFLTNPILPDSQSIATGEALYRGDCAMCHGPMGLGDGPSAVGLNPAPVNFTAGHTAIHSDGDLFYWIENGVSGSAMPAYGAKFSEEELWHLVNYVRRLSVQSVR